MAHAPMRADLVERDLAALQQPHEEWTRHVEQVRRFLRRELGVDGDDGYRVAFTYLGQDVARARLAQAWVANWLA
jgi:hypothetical protein